MGYTTSNIALVPSEDRDWFVFMLDDRGEDPLRIEVRAGFDFMVAKSGPKALIIKGVDRDEFFSQVFKLYRFEDQGFEFDKFPLPALLVTDTSPKEIIYDDAILKKSKMIIFPLRAKYFKAGDLTEFFKILLITLKDPAAMLALDELDEKSMKEKWAWLSEYFELTPHFFGFDIHVNKIIQDFFVE